MSSRIVRQIASWIAVLAIAAVTFMPALTTVMSDAPFDGVVCSADAGPAGAPGGQPHALDHCPYCALHAELLQPAPAPAHAVAVALSFRELPAAFLRAPRASTTWSTAQSRAPPVLA